MNEQNLSDVYEAHVWDVYGFFAYRLRSRHQAEDLTQATFERAARAWSRYDTSRSKPKTWLLAIANNLLIDHFRSDRSAQHVPLQYDGEEAADLPTVAGPDPADLALDPDLDAALAKLGDRERQVLALRFGGDLTGKEIAELLDLSLANTQQILSRSLRRLRSLLEATEVGSGATGGSSPPG